MNTAELTDKLIERTGLSARDARAAIDAIFDPDPAIGLIAASLVAGEKIAISGFGTFEARGGILTPGRRSIFPRRGPRLSKPENP